MMMVRTCRSGSRRVSRMAEDFVFETRGSLGARVVDPEAMSSSRFGLVVIQSSQRSGLDLMGRRTRDSRGGDQGNVGPGAPLLNGLGGTAGSSAGSSSGRKLQDPREGDSRMLHGPAGRLLRDHPGPGARRRHAFGSRTGRPGSTGVRTTGPSRGPGGLLIASFHGLGIESHDARLRQSRRYGSRLRCVFS